MFYNLTDSREIVAIVSTGSIKTVSFYILTAVKRIYAV